MTDTAADDAHTLRDLLADLAGRNQALEEVIAERTRQLSEAVDALHESEGRYRSILHASPDDITITDAAGRIVAVTSLAQTIFGYPDASAFVGRPITDFIVPEERERARARIALKHQGIAIGSSEYHGLRVDGSTVDVEVNSEIIRDADGRPTGMVFIVRDIRERKRLEAAARQLQKSESLGLMAGAIAHHFNNLLGAVIGNLELAVMDLPAGSGPTESIGEAVAAAHRAAAMSGQMLIYLGQSRDTREPLDLAEACRATLPVLRAVVPGPVVLEAQLPSPGPVIDASPNQVQQVVTNLVTNAWEAAGTGSAAVRLRVDAATAESIPAVRRFPPDWQPQPGPFAYLEVRDTGCGIEDVDVERLFDPFFSTKFIGRGMGLAVVLGIVKAHDGVITVESEPGRGSTFRVYFPASA